ncbi:MAG: hypothetical protein KF773_29990 [Deltaproteobacteria bacterium]|nr:hypothetical protein [Deltaproteobacteria bacterium]MCW5804722.1 hypothetical protein [Deltaproteobacteria bacterium]
MSARVTGAPAADVALLRDITARLDRELVLPHPVGVVIRECGEANAFYNVGERTIRICHELWDKRRRMWGTSVKDHAEIDRRLGDAMIFTLLHELGHALRLELELPLIGRMEDAIDDFATLWMMRSGYADAAAVAARGHYARAQQPGYRHDHRDEHSSGLQRGFAMACTLYGSNPARYQALVAEMGAGKDRLAQCRRDYPRQLKAWDRLLGPHLRRATVAGT